MTTRQSMSAGTQAPEPTRPFGLTVHIAASSGHALTVAAWWWTVGIVLALVYFTVAYRLFLRERRATAPGLR